MKRTNGSLLRSFGHALRGIGDALTRERNLRIHLTAGAFVLFFVRYYDFSRVELAVLVLTIGFVISAEMMNTALEKAVDLATSETHPLARFAKDAAAGAVLVAAVASVAVGVLLFWDVAVIKRIWYDIVERPLVAVVVAVASVVWVVFPSGKK